MTPEQPQRKPSARAAGRSSQRAGTPERRSQPPSSDAIRRLIADLYSVASEMLRIPIAGFFAVAEFAGKWVLKASLVVWPLLQIVWRAALRLLGFLERELTPARGVAVVAGVAALALAFSQFSDYRGVDIGSDAYAGVSTIAPAPQVDQATAGSAHAWLGIPLAVIALALIALAVGRRAGLARLLSPIGIAVVAISLLNDVPSGLDASNTKLIYDQVQAQLLGGFWTQLSAGVVLIVVGPILAAYLEGGKRTGEPRVSAERTSTLSRLRGMRPGKAKPVGSS